MPASTPLGEAKMIEHFSSFQNGLNSRKEGSTDHHSMLTLFSFNQQITLALDGIIYAQIFLAVLSFSFLVCKVGSCQKTTKRGHKYQRQNRQSPRTGSNLGSDKGMFGDLGYYPKGY